MVCCLPLFNMAAVEMSEDELGRKWDKCLTDSVLKLGGGLLIGATFSLLFFKRRSWPVWLGAGFGTGMAYANCERDLNGSLSGAECVMPIKKQPTPAADKNEKQ